MQAFIAVVACVLACPSAPAQPPDHSDVSESRVVPNLPRRSFDEAEAARLGIRKLSGKHLTLFTDLSPSAEADALPAVFDQAFVQYCRYFGLAPEKLIDWRMTGCVIRDKARFQKTGMLSADVPPFKNGYSRNDQLWLYEQPSDYYRRHLLLHEGVHGFMNTVLGACGPPWYMEGVAEFLATHCWREGRLTLGYMPTSRDEVPMWGRIRLIQDAVAARRAKTLPDVIRFDGRAHLATEAYAWSWAAVILFENDPRYHERFRELQRHVLEPDFNRHFQQVYAADWQALCEQWQLLVVDLQYGHNIHRTAVDFVHGESPPATGAQVKVAADRGWQSSRVRLEAGKTYRLKATGRYQLAAEPRIWWCEPNGITIHYHQGKPLGLLLAAVRPDRPSSDAPSALLRPIEVGLGTTVTPKETGTLYLKINDSPGRLTDNAGCAVVAIIP